MITKDAIFESVRDAMVELFELDPNDIRLEKRLYQDLDLDSIDAVDLVVKLQEISGKKIRPEDFKEVRTVQDVVNAVYELMCA
jgi:acyl carrier protein